MHSNFLIEVCPTSIVTSDIAYFSKKEYNKKAHVEMLNVSLILEEHVPKWVKTQISKVE